MRRVKLVPIMLRVIFKQLASARDDSASTIVDTVLLNATRAVLSAVACTPGTGAFSAHWYVDAALTTLDTEDRTVVLGISWYRMSDRSAVMALVLLLM